MIHMSTTAVNHQCLTMVTIWPEYSTRLTLFYGAVHPQQFLSQSMLKCFRNIRLWVWDSSTAAPQTFIYYVKYIKLYKFIKLVSEKPVWSDLLFPTLHGQIKRLSTYQSSCSRLVILYITSVCLIVGSVGQWSHDWLRLVSAGDFTGCTSVELSKQLFTLNTSGYKYI